MWGKLDEEKKLKGPEEQNKMVMIAQDHLCSPLIAGLPCMSGTLCSVSYTHSFSGQRPQRLTRKGSVDLSCDLDDGRRSLEGSSTPASMSVSWGCCNP